MTYLALILVLSYLLLQYALPLLLPFVLAFLIAYVLRRPIRFLSRVLHAPKGLVAVLLVVLTYGTIGLLLALAGIRITATITSVVQQILCSIPPIFSRSSLTFSPGWRSCWPSWTPPSCPRCRSCSPSCSICCGSWSPVSPSYWWAVCPWPPLSPPPARLPDPAAADGDFHILHRRRLPEDRAVLPGLPPGSTRNLVLQVKAYVVGTLFVCIRSYALIMSITFVELSVGLTLIGVNRAILVALLIAIFDILPVLGTGGIMIPWVILSALGGDLPHAFALLVLYVIITVIRNIIEPRIVGAQIGLHPVLTLMSMFVGNHLFGIVGLFGLPILLSLLRYLNDNGTISLFPASALGRADTETSR
ncbi:MAG: AI-2E family transporter [Dysosmobacter welbionis]